MAMVHAGLDALNTADLGSLPSVVQAECLRGLDQIGSKYTAARSGVLSVFTAQRGFEDDGQHGPRPWLTWQAQVTGAAAGSMVAWARRLAAHPVAMAAMAAGSVSVSWARQVCDWTSKLPADRRDAADEILLTAAEGGADLNDLAGLFEKIRRELARPDDDGGGDDGFDDRCFRLGITLGGTARAEGDLSAGCAAALSAVLGALSRKTGPEDTRTIAQRRHDGRVTRRPVGLGIG